MGFLRAIQKRGAAGPLPSRPVRCGERLFGGLGRSILGRGRHDRDELAAADPDVKLHRTTLKREQRMVAAHADPVAGVKLGAALAHDDVAGDDDLAAEFLDAEPLTGTVAAVARGAARLLVCHLWSSCARSDPGVDLGDPQHGLVLAVAVLA